MWSGDVAIYEKYNQATADYERMMKSGRQLSVLLQLPSAKFDSKTATVTFEGAKSVTTKYTMQKETKSGVFGVYEQFIGKISS